MEILYSYDDLGRMTEVKQYVDGSNDEILMDGIQYNIENFLTQYDFGNDLRATFSYDSSDRLLTLDLKNGHMQEILPRVLNYHTIFTFDHYTLS